jgi:hypothetical protein
LSPWCLFSAVDFSDFIFVKIYSKFEYLCPWTVSSSTILNSVVHFQSCIFIFLYVYFFHCIERGVSYANFRFFRNISEIVIQIVWLETYGTTATFVVRNLLNDPHCFYLLIYSRTTKISQLSYIFILKKLTQDNQFCINSTVYYTYNDRDIRFIN